MTVKFNKNHNTTELTQASLDIFSKPGLVFDSVLNCVFNDFFFVFLGF